MKGNNKRRIKTRVKDLVFSHVEKCSKDINRYRYHCWKYQVRQGSVECRRLGQLVTANKCRFTLQQLGFGTFDKFFYTLCNFAQYMGAYTREGPISGKEDQTQRKNIPSGLYAIFFALAQVNIKIGTTKYKKAQQYGTNSLYIIQRHIEHDKSKYNGYY